MIFSLEALQAKHGDALLLHYGPPAAPKLIVIDGGPAGVYKAALKPRLDQLRAARAADGRLPIRMVMVSHLDDDHINGVLAMVNGLADAAAANKDRPYEVDELWHNSFDDVIGPTGVPAGLAKVAATAAADGGVPAGAPMHRHAAAVLASVPQGRNLRDAARRLGLDVNRAYDGGLVTTADGSFKKTKVDAGLSFTVLGPDRRRVDELQAEWDAKIKALGLAKLAAYVDESVFNLASIVVLAEVGGRTMLLTGDARGDDVLRALREAKLLKAKPFHVDVLKIPHHGSDHNVDTDFFRDVTADHYVVSGDGKHGNPEPATLEMLVEARGADRYTVHVTNREPRSAAFLDKAAKAAGRKFKVVYRKPSALSVRVDLGDPLPD
jgi:hypothetical protein